MRLPQERGRSEGQLKITIYFYYYHNNFDLLYVKL